MKKKILVLISALTLAFTGCDYANVETVNDQQETEKEPVNSMFVEIEKSYTWKVVYQRDTKVMYVISYGSYNGGNFTLLVNPDGTPMIWEGK